MPSPFSLLLPVYRRDVPDQLARAFKSSVNDQVLRPTEVVLVQDGPVPSALRSQLEQLVEQAPVETSLVVLERNGGLAEALTQGLQRCRHEIVARMDADDISLPERFARQLEVMGQGFDIVGTSMFEFEDENGKMLTRRTPPLEHDEILRYARFHDPFNHPTVIYRKAAVAKAGGYRDIGLMEDYWLFGRMLHSGAKARNLVDPLVLYRVGGGAYSRRGGMNQLKAELSLQKEFRRIGFTSRIEAARNIVVRGGYRLVPEALRRGAYRRLVASGVGGRRAPRTD